MRALYFALCFLLLAAGAAFAAETVECEGFSLQVPDGWQVLHGPQKHQYGYMVVLSGPGRLETVNVNITSSLGLDIEQLIDKARKKADQKGQSLEIVSSGTDSYTAETEVGNLKVRLVCTLDSDKKELGILAYSASSKEAEAVARTVRTTNPKLQFFK
ncbi:hypothetical protein LJC59_08785, partial [Desulfovibrio sp. OttesenSCG-928-A18]|nr:hypothetical protein [Desulfovibrio sp. OttesenSCG-928-A18]